MKLVKDNENKILETNGISDKEAEDAFRTILAWMGEDLKERDCLKLQKE